MDKFQILEIVGMIDLILEEEVPVEVEMSDLWMTGREIEKDILQMHSSEADPFEKPHQSNIEDIEVYHWRGLTR